MDDTAGASWAERRQVVPPSGLTNTAVSAPATMTSCWTSTQNTLEAGISLTRDHCAVAGVARASRESASGKNPEMHGPVCGGKSRREVWFIADDPGVRRAGSRRREKKGSCPG